MTTNNCATKWPKPVWRRWVSAGHSNWNLAMRAQNLMGIVFLILPIRKTKGKHMKTMKTGWHASCYRISWLYLFRLLLILLLPYLGCFVEVCAMPKRLWAWWESHTSSCLDKGWTWGMDLCTLLGTKISAPKALLKMTFLLRERVGYVSLPKLGDCHNKWQSDCDTMCWHQAHAAPSRGIRYTDLHALPKAKLIVTHSYNQIPAVIGTQILWGSDPWPLDPPGHPKCFKDMFP